MTISEANGLELFSEKIEKLSGLTDLHSINTIIDKLNDFNGILGNNLSRLANKDRVSRLYRRNNSKHSIINNGIWTFLSRKK